MKSQPLVTVLITAYNTNPSYLNEAVKSAINQDYPNLEVLVVDDGSKPSLDSFLGKHPKLKFDYMEHRGVPHGLVRGVEESRGSYIAILDHDDMLTEGSIRSRVEKLEKEKVGLVYGDIDHIDKEGKLYGSTHFRKYSSVSDFVHAILSNPFPPLKHSGIMFDKNVVVRVGNYDPNLSGAYDHDLCIRVAKEAGASHIPKVVARYRTHDNNLTLDLEFRKKGLKSKILIIDKYVDDPFERFYLKGKGTLVSWGKVLLRNKKLAFQKHQSLLELSNYNPRKLLSDMFYVKKAFGKDFRPINIYKVRTMHPNSDERLEDLLNGGIDIDQDGKYVGDPRITSTGKFLRKYWIDELPQFLNLVKGDIKLVGLRAKEKTEWSLYPEEVMKNALKSKPGLFGIQYASREPGGNGLPIRKVERYLEQYNKNPLQTDATYLAKILFNIFIRGVRSS